MRHERLKSLMDNRSIIKQNKQPKKDDPKFRMNNILNSAYQRMLNDANNPDDLKNPAELTILSPDEILIEIQNALGIYDLGVDVLSTQLQKIQEVFESLLGLLGVEEHANLKKALALNANQLSFIITALDNKDLNHNKLPHFISKLTPINGIREYHQIYWLHQIFDPDYSNDVKIKRIEHLATSFGLEKADIQRLTRSILNPNQISEKLQPDNAASYRKRFARIILTILAMTTTSACAGNVAESYTQTLPDVGYHIVLPHSDLKDKMPERLIVPEAYTPKEFLQLVIDHIGMPIGSLSIPLGNTSISFARRGEKSKPHELDPYSNACIVLTQEEDGSFVVYVVKAADYLSKAGSFSNFLKFCRGQGGVNCARPVLEHLQEAGAFSE